MKLRFEYWQLLHIAIFYGNVSNVNALGGFKSTIMYSRDGGRSENMGWRVVIRPFSDLPKSGAYVNVPILKELNSGKMQLCRVEHFYNIFVLIG